MDGVLRVLLEVGAPTAGEAVGLDDVSHHLPSTADSQKSPGRVHTLKPASPLLRRDETDPTG
ncbi:UNVERIFIED_CONTAM: hypothetical protein BEN50_22780 [Euhalothece sp. KZN 001]